MKAAVILPAAGLGTRMGRGSAETTGTSRKQFMLLDGSPILALTVRKFLSSDRVSEIIVAVRAEDLEWVGDLLRQVAAETGSRVPVRAVEGGDTRQQSVENAFAVLDSGTPLVAVHDAVRPFIDLETIAKVVDEAAAFGAAIVGIVPVDTVKQVSGAQASGARVRATISRERLVLAQTPQVFRYDVLRNAFDAARRDGFAGTDESSLVERLETEEVRVVHGSERNIKITRPGDMDLARLFLEQETAKA
ncbi:MAG: 2-C-methyl-D-erythritol 4-phosphate cytidylyltransferase [Steroidobacteraceae bacterium]